MMFNHCLTIYFFSSLILLQSCLPAQQSDPSIDEPSPKQYIVNFSIPSSLDFCGEEVPLSDPEIAERLEREINALAYYHASTLLVLKRAHRWKPAITGILTKENIPEDFFYLAIAESNLESIAESYMEAVGIWQLLEGTARELGLEITKYIDERRDPILSTYAACKYLQRSHTVFNNWTLVAASYNRGTKGITDALSAQKVYTYYDLYLHEETYRYIFKILAYKVILANPEKYGFKVETTDLYQPWDFKEVEVAQSIPDLPQWASQYQTTYKYLKLLNPWITSIDYSLPLKPGKTYVIRVPEN